MHDIFIPQSPFLHSTIKTESTKKVKHFCTLLKDESRLLCSRDLQTTFTHNNKRKVDLFRRQKLLKHYFLSFSKFLTAILSRINIHETLNLLKSSPLYTNTLFFFPSFFYTQIESNKHRVIKLFYNSQPIGCHLYNNLDPTIHLCILVAK